MNRRPGAPACAGFWVVLVRGVSGERQRSSTEPPPGDGIVRVRLETKGRNGKAVTVITGVPLPAPKLTELGKKLK